MQELEMIVKMLFSQAITALNTPVLNFGFTYWQLWIGVFVVDISISILWSIFFESVIPEEKGGNSRYIYISKDRKDDYI